jgi:hypothetical protein
LFKGANGIDEHPIQWRCYALEETKSKNGKPLKKLTLVYKNTSSNEFVEYLKPKIQHFVRHNFMARWQDKHFKTCVKSLPTYFKLHWKYISDQKFIPNWHYVWSDGCTM